MKLTTLDVIAIILVVIGGLNWGLVGLLNVDVVAIVFSAMSTVSRIVYIVVGLAALYLAVVSPRLERKQ